MISAGSKGARTPGIDDAAPESVCRHSWHRRRSSDSARCRARACRARSPSTPPESGGSRLARAPRRPSMHRARLRCRAQPSAPAHRRTGVVSRNRRKETTVASRRACSLARRWPASCRRAAARAYAASARRASPSMCRNAARAGRISRVAVPLIALKRASAASIPWLGPHTRPGEIRHEEQIEMRQMVGGILGRHASGSAPARHCPASRRPAPRRARWPPPSIATPSRSRRCAAYRPERRAGPCRSGSARSRDNSGELTQAARTAPPSMSSLISRSPSTRLNGPTTRRRHLWGFPWRPTGGTMM